MSLLRRSAISRPERDRQQWTRAATRAAAAGVAALLVGTAGGSAVAVGAASASARPSDKAKPSATAKLSGGWSSGGSLVTGRSAAASVVLDNGDVLVAGGFTKPGSAPTSSVELYDPSTGRWSATGSLPVAVGGATATVLDDGNVLVAGGTVEDSGTLAPTAQAEIYDHSSGTWKATGALRTAVTGAGSALVGHGDVLVAGGWSSLGHHGATTRAAELYDPSSGTWSSTGSLPVAVADAATVGLGGGSVLVAGGISQSSGGTPSVTASAEVYDSRTGSFAAVDHLREGVAESTATLLASGDVLVAGGESAPGGPASATAELFDPSRGSWHATGSLPAASFGATATAISATRVLYVGGLTGTSSNPSAMAAVYDTTDGTWSPAAPLPAGRAFVVAAPLGNGTALVAGGQASSSSTSATSEVFTDTVAPRFTSASSLTVHPGSKVSFTVTATGSPAPHILASGQLPSGMTFTAGTSSGTTGTATIAGTPPSGSVGTYKLALSASNGVSPSASQTFTLDVALQDVAPKITSASSLEVSSASATDFTVTAVGTPTPTLAISGQLPPGLGVAVHTNGTATISGRPSGTASATFDVTVTARNSAGSASQTLRITQLATGSAPSFTSSPSVQLATGFFHSVAITASGNPAPAITASGRIPAGMSVQGGADGSATISGVPSPSSAGTYLVYLTAASSSGVTHETLTLSVVQAQPVRFTSAGSVTMRPGSYTSFTVETAGVPSPTLVVSGRLPTGVAFSARPGGTAVIAGDPPVAATGTYVLELTATNDLGVTARQSFRLVVSAQRAPAITSPSSFAVRGGTYAKLTVTASGDPTPRLTLAGRLPDGLHFVDKHDGTGYIYGTPARTISGTYHVEVTATNGVGNAAHQGVAIHVALAPTITFTTKAAAGFTERKYGKFAIRAIGSPAPRFTVSGRLPTGLRYFPKPGGLAYIAGTPWRSAVGRYALTVTASNGIARPVTERLVISVGLPPAAPAIYGSRAVTTRVHAYTKLRIVVTGSPVPHLELSGRLPQGLRFIAPRGHRVVFIAGFAGPASPGAYELVLSAANGVGHPVHEQLRIVVLR